MAASRCYNEEWHPTHRLWRKANVVRCQACRAQAHHRDDRWEPSRALKARFGEERGGPVQLPLIFKVKKADS